MCFWWTWWGSFSAEKPQSALTVHRTVIHFRPFEPHAKEKTAERKPSCCPGGPGGVRTHDLRVANAALSQLSYKPLLFSIAKKVYVNVCFGHLSRQYLSGPPCGSRTRHRRNRNPVLYPYELRVVVRYVR